MLTLRRRDLSLLLWPLVGACRRGNSELPDWETGAASAAGFREGALRGLTAEIAAGAFPNTHAVLIERDGVLIYEQYFAGTDEREGEPLGRRTFDAGALHDLRSVSKSFTSALVGIALGSDFEKAVGRSVRSLDRKSTRLNSSHT